jgi:Septin
MIPFAVVGSERNVIIDGQPVRGRKNRWGVINVENEQHCEFNYLRNFLTRFGVRARHFGQCMAALMQVLVLGRISKI